MGLDFEHLTCRSAVKVPLPQAQMFPFSPSSSHTYLMSLCSFFFLLPVWTFAQQHGRQSRIREKRHRLHASAAVSGVLQKWEHLPREWDLWDRRSRGLWWDFFCIYWVEAHSTAAFHFKVCHVWKTCKKIMVKRQVFVFWVSCGARNGRSRCVKCLWLKLSSQTYYYYIKLWLDAGKKHQNESVKGYRCLKTVVIFLL